jgi:hypothetical protein
MRTDKRTDGYDEANIRFRNFVNAPNNESCTDYFSDTRTTHLHHLFSLLSFRLLCSFTFHIISYLKL